jgi:transcriptional regulator with XRE-family HTH domain
MVYFIIGHKPINLGGIMYYKRIRELREDKDMLQKDIAKLLNCSQVAYSRYELGNRDIPTDVLITLAKFHNTSIDYLLGLTDISTPYKRK